MPSKEDTTVSTSTGNSAQEVLDIALHNLKARRTQNREFRRARLDGYYDALVTARATSWYERELLRLHYEYGAIQNMIEELLVLRREEGPGASEPSDT